MANLDGGFSGGTNSSRYYGRLYYILDSQNTGANSSHISLYLRLASNNGSYSFNGYNNNGQIKINGGDVASGNYTGTVNTSEQQITSWGGNLTHDANGNLSINVGFAIQSGYAGNAANNVGWALPRLPLAPSFTGPTIDTILPTSARLGLTVTSYGHGTSAQIKFFWKKVGDVTYQDSGWLNWTGSTEYFTIPNLIPGTNYVYAAHVINNNGDLNNTTDSPFTTLPAPNTSLALQKVIGLS